MLTQIYSGVSRKNIFIVMDLFKFIIGLLLVIFNAAFDAYSKNLRFSAYYVSSLTVNNSKFPHWFDKSVTFFPMV